MTPTSYAVLGMVEFWQPATPYQLKQFASISVFHFWSVPHTQLYTECERLAGAGLLSETREETGRRRREYRLTDAGQRALDAWRRDPATERQELRDVGVLKLFFGADPATLAAGQIAEHEARFEELTSILAERGDVMPDGMRLALEIGIAYEQGQIGFWRGFSE